MDSTTPPFPGAPGAVAGSQTLEAGTLLRPSRWRSTAAGLGSVLLAFLAATALLEMGMRMLRLGPPPRGPNNNQPLTRVLPEQVAPGLGEGLLPNAIGKVLYPGHGEDPERWVHYRINADGFRDVPRERSKPAGTFRIALLGDSVTYGTGVDLRDTLSQAMQRTFDERFPDRTVEVMNCGVYAHNTSQQVAWLEYAVLPFEPDLVVIVSTVTDASGRNVPKLERELAWEGRWIQRLGLTSGTWEVGEEQSAAQRFTMGLRRHSRLADLFAHRAYGFLRCRLMAQGYELDWAPGSPGLALVESSIERAAALARERGFELAVAMYPTLTTLDENYPFQNQTATLAAICAERELPFFDLFDLLRGRRATDLHAHAHDRHPNAAAHALVGAGLVEHLAPYVTERP